MTHLITNFLDLNCLPASIPSKSEVLLPWHPRNESGIFPPTQGQPREKGIRPFSQGAPKFMLSLSASFLIPSSRLGNIFLVGGTALSWRWWLLLLSLIIRLE